MAIVRPPRGLPLGPEIGQRVGLGQDNAVYELVNSADKPHLRTATGWVTKINHKITTETHARIRHEDPQEATWRGVQYKKNKYDILKHFLGDFIPDSSFVMTTAQDGGNGQRYVELTLQRKVPKYSLNDLNEVQRSDPRLRTNLSSLLQRMQYMYRILGEVNARTSQGMGLDAKLDLGGLSDTITSERLDHVFDDQQLNGILNKNKSPNLLVDPESMQLYCIDFDQGQWLPGMDDAKRLAFELDGQYQHDITQALGSTAVSGQQI